MAAEGSLSAEQKKLYDRQLYELGMGTMAKLVQQRVLIVGMRGLGVEIAKNVILAGPKAVCLADAATVDISDLSAQFYLTPEDIGHNRAESCVGRLRELNPYVEVTAHTGPITSNFVSEFTFVVMTSSTPEEKIRVDAFCHQQQPPIPFITSDVHGLFGYLFHDFGPAHTVHDVDGEKARVGYVSSISQSNPAIVTFLEDFPYAFQNDDHIVFSEVQGMTQINGIRPASVRIKDKFNIEVDLDTTGFSPYVGGGIMTQVKRPVTVAARTLAECIANPGDLMVVDMAHFERPGQLHVAFQGLHAFQSRHNGALPELGNVSHEGEVVELAKEAAAKNPNGPQVDEAITRKLARHARAELSPITSIFGGIVAQEVIKVTGKYMPFQQFLYYDALECLPSEDLLPSETQPLGGRYDGQIAVFGRSFQEKLGKLRNFLVGAGALGCELLKGYAMMGVGCAEGGLITVTDMDHIEQSNLNRQFLFRNNHMGQSKSQTAARVIRDMNKAINIRALEARVGVDTENVFDDTFWTNVDIVTNALDNIPARLYVDSRCVEFRKPLLESGTLGSKANVQVVVPGETESYGSSRDPQEKETPTCTLHNFPYLIEHCIQLAREQFETQFFKSVLDTHTYLSRGAEHFNTIKNAFERRATVEAVDDVLRTFRAVTFADCVAWARAQFEVNYNHRVRNMLGAYPADAVDSNGNPFWSGTKRVPHPLTFDANDELHIGFIIAAANLRGSLFKLAPVRDVAEVRRLVANAPVPAFVSKVVKIQTQPDANAPPPAPEVDTEDSAVADRVAGGLVEMAKGVASTSLMPQEFEKDDDTNFHVDFISAAANLRARCYTIPEADQMRIKGIAGRIIPALATTTAMTTGFVLLELYKLLQGRPVDQFRNTFVNLAIPLLTVSEPVPPKKMKAPGPQGERYYPEGFTLWDRFDVPGDVTLKELVDWFKKNHNLDLTSVTGVGGELIYMNFYPTHAARLPKKVTELYMTAAKRAEMPERMKRLQVVVGCEDDSGDVEVPVVYIHFR